MKEWTVTATIKLSYNEVDHEDLGVASSEEALADAQGWFANEGINPGLFDWAVEESWTDE